MAVAACMLHNPVKPGSLYCSVIGCIRGGTDPQIMADHLETVKLSVQLRRLDRLNPELGRWVRAQQGR